MHAYVLQVASELLAKGALEGSDLVKASPSLLGVSDSYVPSESNQLIVVGHDVLTTEYKSEKFFKTKRAYFVAIVGVGVVTALLIGFRLPKSRCQLSCH
jgi:hypothetical protein